jgi:hypothetical protein
MKTMNKLMMREKKARRSQKFCYKSKKSKNSDKILHHITNWDNDQVQAVLARYSKESIVSFLVLISACKKSNYPTLRATRLGVHIKQRFHYVLRGI